VVGDYDFLTTFCEACQPEQASYMPMYLFWHSCRAEERAVIQSIYKGIEIELEMHQQTGGYWKCDTMLITRPGRKVTLVKGTVQLPSLKMAKEYAIEEARAVIDNAESLRLSVHELGLAPVFQWV
jgi:hypothetical protein